MAVLVSIVIIGHTGTASSARGQSLWYAENVISRGKAKTLIICRMTIPYARRCSESPRSHDILDGNSSVHVFEITSAEKWS